MKFTQRLPVAFVPESLPVRGAWIEIAINVRKINDGGVAPREGSVD